MNCSLRAVHRFSWCTKVAAPLDSVVAMCYTKQLALWRHLSPSVLLWIWRVWRQDRKGDIEMKENVTAHISCFLMKRWLLASGGFPTSALCCMTTDCHRCLCKYEPLDRDREEKSGITAHTWALHLLFQGKYLLFFMDVLKSSSFCLMQKKKINLKSVWSVY